MNTPQEMVEKNMTLFTFSAGGWKNYYLTDPDPNMRKLAETMIETWDPDEYYNLTIYGALRDGTHAQIAPAGWVWLNGVFLWANDFEAYNEGRGWYRSKERIPGDYPYNGYITRKNWFLNEVLYVLSVFSYILYQ